MRPGVDSDRMIRVIVAVADRLASRAGASLSCFKEFSSDELDTVAPLEDLGYTRVPSLPSCYLPLPYHSFDEYVAAMRAGYRRQLRATERARERAGLKLRTEDFAQHVTRIFPLYEQVIDRAEFQLERLNQAFFHGLAAELPEARVTLAEDASGHLVCAAVLLRGPRHVTFLLSGIDYSRHREALAYENLVIGVIRQAIEWGAEGIELGQTSWELKQRLGATLTSRYLFFRHRGPIARPALRAALPALFPDRRFPRRRVFRDDG
jgi:predicted N-acyltransferase